MLCHLINPVFLNSILATKAFGVIYRKHKYKDKKVVNTFMQVKSFFSTIVKNYFLLITNLLHEERNFHGVVFLWSHNHVATLLTPSCLVWQFPAYMQVTGFFGGFKTLRSLAHLIKVLYTYQLFLSQMREIFTLSWLRFPEMSRGLPKISDEFPKTSKRCQKI